MLVFLSQQRLGEAVRDHFNRKYPLYLNPTRIALLT